MSKSRSLTHLISVSLLFIWSAVLLYFYYSGRVNQYLPGDGIFRPMVLVTGIGLTVIGLFNLMTMNAAVAGCEGHDHGHDHSHGHYHHDHGCCGHEHHHHDHVHGDCGHSHSTAKASSCCDHDHDHDHGHHHHAHAHEHVHTHTPSHGGCCGHDHGHGHSHSHEEHGHGIMEEYGWTGRLVAIFFLAAPITWAAFNTPDRFSASAVMNKGVYDQNYNSTTRAEEYSLRKPSKASQSPQPKAGLAAAPASTASLPPQAAAPAVAAAPSPDAPPDRPTRAAPQPTPMPDTPPPAPAQFNDPAKVEQAAAKPKEAQSFGSFSLEDLKQQVPQNSKGEFMLEVPEIFYTGGDIEVQRVLDGQKIETVAQVLPEKVNNANGYRLRIFRMQVQCCAADARPYSIPVDFGKKAPDLKEMTWVKISGVMSYEKDADQTVPVVKALEIEETTPPENTMIY